MNDELNYMEETPATPMVEETQAKLITMTPQALGDRL